MFKVIKSEKEHQAALAEIERLIDLDPEIGTEDSDNLELLTLLVQNYESEKYVIAPPDPIDAILFRMEQQNLSQRDLIPYLGSRSKVSEVLSRKRPLTLTMMQALHHGLGIPAKVLLLGNVTSEEDAVNVDWSRFPIREMISRSWIANPLTDIRSEAESLLRQFFQPIGIDRLASALYRRTKHIRSVRRMDEYALTAWSARVVARALATPPTTIYKSATITVDFMKQLINLSIYEDGPIRAQKYLREHGIVLVIEPHLQHTYVDGVVLWARPGLPVIGLTLRFDRIDNFWFCLFHELAHIALHLDNDSEIEFYDDLEIEESEDLLEREADEFAGEALISKEAWRKSAARLMPSPDAAQLLARQLGIHPAIVAGKMRYELKAYRILNNLVGHNMVRKHFQDVKWE